DPNNSCCPWGAHSWAALILPFIEGDNQFRSMNLTAPSYAQNVGENNSSDTPGGWGPAARDRGPGQPTWQGKANPNILAASNMPKSFTCPSSPAGQFSGTTPQKYYAVMYDNSINLNGTSGGEKCCPERRLVSTISNPWNGMGYLMSEIKMAEVSDGTSNTIML